MKTLTLNHRINYRSRIEAWTIKDKSKRLVYSYKGNIYVIEGYGAHPAQYSQNDCIHNGKSHSKYPKTK